MNFENELMFFEILSNDIENIDKYWHNFKKEILNNIHNSNIEEANIYLKRLQSIAKKITKGKQRIALNDGLELELSIGYNYDSYLSENAKKKKEISIEWAFKILELLEHISINSNVNKSNTELSNKTIQISLNNQQLENLLEQNLKSKEFQIELDRISGHSISATGEFKNPLHRDEFSKYFELLYNSSLKEMYLWQYAPFKVYESSINERCTEYLKKKPDSSELNFYYYELKELESNYRDERFEDFGSGGIEIIKLKAGFIYELIDKEFGCVNIWLGFLNDDLLHNIELTQNKKVNYIHSRIESFKNKPFHKMENVLSEISEINEKEFDELNKKYKYKYGIDFPIGAYLFKIIKEESCNLDTNIEKVKFLKNKLHYWIELSLTNEEIITEPEIKDRLIPLLKNEIESLEIKSNNEINLLKPYKKKNFQTKITIEKKVSLYKLLVDEGFIHPETKKEFFLHVFGESLPNSLIFEPITWISEPVLLAYFIYKLKTNKIINSPHYWAITEKCFNPASNLRQLADGFQNSKSGKPRRSQEIDDLLSILV